eukprot:3933064-Rhodomonas_salina.1
MPAVQVRRGHGGDEELVPAHAQISTSTCQISTGKRYGGAQSCGTAIRGHRDTRIQQGDTRR